MRKYIVYKITHVPTEMVYVGRKTATLENFEKYWGGSTHPLFASKTNKKVINRYETFIQDNIDDYTKEIIEICSNSSELGKRETYWIRHFKQKGLSVNKSDNHKWTTAGMTKKELYGDKHEEIMEDSRQRRIKYNKSEAKRQSVSKYMKENNPMNNPENRKKVGKAKSEFYKNNPEIAKQNAIRLKEAAWTPEAIEKRRKAMKNRSVLGKNDAFEKACAGTKWIHKDTEQKRIKSELLQEYLNNGWKSGRLPRKEKI